MIRRRLSYSACCGELEPTDWAASPMSEKGRGFSVIRPILDLPRTDIGHTAGRTTSIRWKTTPISRAFTPEIKIRLELLPLLEQEYNENIRAGLRRMGKIAAADSDYLQTCAEESLQKILRGKNRR